MDAPRTRRSLADVMVSLSMTCAAVALIRLLVVLPTNYRPGVPAALLLALLYWPGVIATTVAATATCVAGWRRALRWAALALAGSAVLLPLWVLLLTLWQR